MKIAIIDWSNQDIGLKLLFPEADYFITRTENSTISYRIKSNKKYNIMPNHDIDSITDKKYDTLFIIFALYNTVKSKFFCEHAHNAFTKIKSILDTNKFNYVAIFDNFDYDYDPNSIIDSIKPNIYFKRNYSTDKIYNTNVCAFPFIMFGEISLIEKCDSLLTKEEYFKPKLNRVFFSGSIFTHDDPAMGVYRDRRLMYSKICGFIYNPGNLPYDQYMSEMSNSKFGLDLMGVGDPNKRTFEILISGSLMIQQKSTLRWPFPEKFPEELSFTTVDEFLNIINKLLNDNDLYNTYLQKQYEIVTRYFNKVWIKSYILSCIDNSARD